MEETGELSGDSTLILRIEPFLAKISGDFTVILKKIAYLTVF
ncbi:hypothetical protein [Cytobacillus gottheilii]